MISKLTAFKIFVEVVIIVPLLLIETGIYFLLRKPFRENNPFGESAFDDSFMKGYAVIILFAIALWKFYDWESVPLNLPVFLM